VAVVVVVTAVVAVIATTIVTNANRVGNFPKGAAPVAAPISFIFSLPV